MSFLLCFIIGGWCSFDRELILTWRVIYFSRDSLAYGTQRRAHWIFVKCLTWMHNHCQLRERMALMTTKSENGKLQVAGNFPIHAQTVADTERVHWNLVPPILALTFLPTDLDEISCCRTPTLHHPFPNPHKVSSCSTWCKARSTNPLRAAASQGSLNSTSKPAQRSCSPDLCFHY